MRIDMNEWREIFADGWTDDTIDHELPSLGERLGLRVVCVWARREDGEPAGDSELVVLLGDGTMRELPEGLWELLLDGEGDGMIDTEALGEVRSFDMSEAHWTSPSQVCLRGE